tara:strand:- start:668 stop:1204 length:537 start_codon:yes stop_codon:yes gene_type:complete
MAKVLERLLTGTETNEFGRTYYEQFLFDSGSGTFEEAENSFVGIDLPFMLGDIYGGNNAITKTTLAAVKTNVFNLLSTEVGERVMQPNLGVKLRKYLFEPFTDEVIVGIQQTITDAFTYWLPFVIIQNINVRMSEENNHQARNSVLVSVTFSLSDDPNKYASVQVTVGEGVTFTAGGA